MTNNQTNVYWTVFTVRDWKIYLAATERGICYVGSPNQPFDELEKWVSKKIPSAHLVQSSAHLQSATSELTQYILGESQTFTIEKDLIGTDFQQAVWQASAKIPYGETRNYSQVAEQIGRPNAIRAVGTAIGANPLLFIIPCHRIVAKNGGLAGFRAGIDVKEKLLQLETINNT